MKRLFVILKSLLQIGKKAIFLLGCSAAVLILLSFTDYPYFAYHWLGTKQISKPTSVEYIVVLGAGGMPGPQGILRCYFASETAAAFPNSKIIVSLPADSNNFEKSDHFAMIAELIARGVSAERIESEIIGTNTYTQAQQIKKRISNKQLSLLIVTSPEHMYRSILTFRKAGFTNVNGLPTFEHAFDEELLLEPLRKSKAGKKPDSNLNLRYNMWSYLQYEIVVMREWTALAYYKLMGYI